MTAPKNSILSLRLLLILMAILTGLTWWVGQNISRYTVQTSEVPDDFPSEISEWSIRENWKNVEELAGFSLLPDGIRVSRNTPGISTAEFRIPLPENKPVGAKLLAGAELTAQAVSGGVKDWHGLLFTIWFYDDTGERIKKTARTVQALVGDTAPLRYTREIDLPPQAVEAGIGLRIFESTGTATLRAPQLNVVSPWSGYRSVILAVLAVWAIYGLLVVIALASRAQLLYAIVPMAIIAIIAIGVSLPSDELRRLTKPLEQIASGKMPYLRDLGFYSVTKVGHALGFALLTLFACAVRARLGATWLGIACFLILLAVLTEGVQMFFVGRSTRIADMAIDLSGAGVGAVVFFVLWLITNPFRKKSRSSHPDIRV